MHPLSPRIAAGLARTRELLLTDVSDLLRPGGGLDPDSLEELEDRLLAADLGVETAAAICDRLREENRRRRIPDPGAVMALVAEVVEESLLEAARPRNFDGIFQTRPRVVMMVGVNGCGKTTAIGKLAHLYGTAGKQVVVAAADTYRAAAVEQLQIWADRSGAYCVRSHEGADAASVAYDALEAATARGADVLLVDTAGRLHTRKGLMDELSKIKRVLASRMEGAPHETLLVLDATTGQNALVQAEEFKKAAGVTGIILTKLDGTARGGIVVAVAERLGIPVEMIGIGEGIDDLRPFDAHEFASALLSPETIG